MSRHPDPRSMPIPQEAAAATDRPPLVEGLAGPKRAHPPGLYLLFITEMWERFSYYGMKAFLILYMTLPIATGALAWDTKRAGTVYGWYSGLVYLTPLVGGYLADRFLGTHWAMVIGGVIIAAGHFTLAAMDMFAVGSDANVTMFFAGLGLIVAGTGFFKPCVSVMVGQLYQPQDSRRDAAFTIFYMGINLGAFLGPLVCGGLRLAKQTPDGVYGWNWAFGAAGVGMLLGLIIYFIGRPFLLRGIGLPRQRGVETTKGATCGSCGSSLAGLEGRDVCPECGRPVNPHRGKGPLTKEEKQHIAVIFIMAFFVIFFWTAFEQAGGSMNLFAENMTDRSLPPPVAEGLYRFGNEPGYGVSWWILTLAGVVLTGLWMALDLPRNSISKRVSAAGPVLKILGLAIGLPLVVTGLLKGSGFLGGLFPKALIERPEYPAEWFQSVNPLFILLLAPLFAALWVQLGRRGKEPSTPVKFALGLILLGGGFVFMVLGAQEAAGPGGSIVKVSGMWLLAAYFVNTMAELCLSPVGLSMVTKLSPLRFVSLLMGVWFLSSFVSNLAAGLLTGFSEDIAKTGFILDGLPGFFLLFVILPAGAGIALLALVPMLKRMMHGKA